MEETILNASMDPLPGLFTWNQNDRMNMTEIGEHDRKIDNDAR